MRLLSIIFTLILSCTTFAQDKYGLGAVPVKDGVVIFSEIVPINGESKEGIYSKAKLAITDIFKDSQKVIQLDDKDNGIVVCKGTSVIHDPLVTSLMEFTLKISCKDERVKIDIYNIALTIGYGSTPSYYRDCNQTITDEVSFKNGKLKKQGEGKQRRMVIDRKDEIFASIISKLTRDTTAEEDW